MKLTIKACSHRLPLTLSLLALILSSSALLADTVATGTAAQPKTSSSSTSAKNDPKEITPVLAEQTPAASPFQFDIGVPTWMTAVNGTMGVKGVAGQVNIPFYKIWDHLDIVVPLAMDFRYQKFGFHIDGQYVKLSEGFNPQGGFYSAGTVTIEQAMANFNVNYRVLDTDRWQVDTSLGGRYNYLGLNGTLTSKAPAIRSNFNESGSTSWVDPIIGTNAKFHVYKPFSLLMLGDVGGFGVGSHITYQFYGAGEVQLAKHFYMDLGYRYIYTDYSSGGTTYNVDMKGPQLTFGGNF